METVAPLGKVLLTWWLWFLGAHTAVVFGQAGYDVAILDNLSNSYLDVLGKIEELSWKKVSFYDVDLRNYDALKQVLRENLDVDCVLHFWAKKHLSESCQDPFYYYDHNLTWSINLTKAMLEVKMQKNIIFSSSGTVYDSKNSLPPFAETDVLDPTTPYATTQMITERIFKDMSLHKHFNAIVLRHMNVIGAHHSGVLWEHPKGTPSHLVPYVYQVAKGDIEELQVYGTDYDTKDGTWVKDYLHVMDLAESYLLAFQYINEFEEYHKQEEKIKGLYDVFNITTGEGLSVKEIITLVERITEKKVAYKTNKRRVGDVDTLIGNPQKAKQILWWQPKRSVYQALEDGRRYIYKNVL